MWKKPILTQRQIKKLDEIEKLICEFPPLKKGGESIKANAKDLFKAYSPTLAGTPIKNISTRLRDFWDFVRRCANKTNSDLIKICDDNIDSYSDYLKTELNNNQNTIFVKMSHIRAVLKWAEEEWIQRNWRGERQKIGRTWKYKVRGKPFQKKENSSKVTLPVVDPRRCLPYIEEVEQPQPKPQTTKKRGNPFRKSFLYDLLGVAPTATTEEIRRGYKKRIVAIHPDRTHSEEQAKALNMALEYIIEHRQDYDWFLVTNIPSTKRRPDYDHVADQTRRIYALFGGYPSLYKLENRI
jgi:hypothetical protein